MLGHETVALSARRQRQEKPRQRGQARKDQGLPRPIRSPWSAQAPGPPAPRLQQMQAGAAAAVPSKKISWRLPFLTGSSKRAVGKGKDSKASDGRQRARAWVPLHAVLSGVAVKRFCNRGVQ
ncbi:hypothetical protein B296_00058191 [Ensete ventricosum]|uniref:Uncharacterized protein n=1 Tax=Ensete ventricosum TaxID=4639 RepID=A0A426X187_ENSVE|nr:hypothetical protein B296_00058191 [Ensete ventricosum]